VRRIGGTRTIQVDIRVVAATNRDLGVEVNRGRFREDLYYRLAVARVHVPPLRERREDIELLIEHFLSVTPNAEGAELAPDTVELMKKHDWPGNVRELRNVIERALLLSEATPMADPRLRSTAPQRAIEGEASEPVPAVPVAILEEETMAVAIDTRSPFKLAKQALVTEFERRYIRRLLAEHGGNISAAARVAGIDRMSIHKMLNRLGIDNPGRDER
jgi:DNA-binding NtrC family response regulator